MDKKCNYCLITFDISNFTIDNHTKDKFSRACKKCKNDLYLKKKAKRQVVVENLDGEIWRFIKGYEGVYMASSCGRIKACEREYNHPFFKEKPKRFDRILKPILNSNGYMVVNFHNNGVRKQFMVHRLVAETFLDNENNYPIINHKNAETSDNRVENLEWCNFAENLCHSYLVSKNRTTFKTSKYTGVSWVNRDKKWVVTIHDESNNKRVYLGSFNDEKTASRVYNKEFRNLKKKNKYLQS